MTGKVQPTIALTTHRQKMAVPFMTPRTLFGKISPIMVHTIVPFED